MVSVVLSPRAGLERLALRFQLVIAQRKGEVVGAEWSEIDFATGWWTIPAEKAKNNQAQCVPLSELAMDLLNQVKEICNHPRWVFPSEKTTNPITGAAIDHAVRHSTFKGIKSFTPHDPQWVVLAWS